MLLLLSTATDGIQSIPAKTEQNRADGVFRYSDISCNFAKSSTIIEEPSLFPKNNSNYNE